jgi:general stress protein CsbA
MGYLADFIEKYWIVLATVLSILIGSAFMIRLISRNVAEKNDVSKNIWSYVFIWPLLLTKKEEGKSIQRDLTRKEWIGIIILIVIMLLALIFTPPTGRG